MDILLVSPDFSKGDGTGPVPVRLLDSTRSLRGGLSGSLGSDCARKARRRRASVCEGVAREEVRARAGGTEMCVMGGEDAGESEARVRR